MSLNTYQVHAYNPSHESENRIHSDSVAKQFGFKGALVPGVSVFSYMTQPLVARFGEAWLARGAADEGAALRLAADDVGGSGGEHGDQRRHDRQRQDAAGGDQSGDGDGDGPLRPVGGETDGEGDDGDRGHDDVRTFGHILVDEAQDLTPMQWRMLARRGPAGSMTLVGDFGQASRPGA